MTMSHLSQTALKGYGGRGEFHAMHLSTLLSLGISAFALKVQLVENKKRKRF